jgi:transglutaminase-like putative cysteine protease
MISGFFKKLAQRLTDKGDVALATSVEELGKTIEQETANIITSGSDILKRRLHEAQRGIIDKIDPRLADLLNIKVGPNETYSVIITEDEHHPFQINEAIQKQAVTITAAAKNELEKAKALFNWFVKNVNYGDQKRKSGTGYRHAKEVYTDREGVCGEMAVLYIVMARYVGLKSNYVSVTRDNGGNKVHHACAAVHVQPKPVLIDPAYHEFDVKHREFRILTDKEAVPHLKSFRGQN